MKHRNGWSPSLLLATVAASACAAGPASPVVHPAAGTVAGGSVETGDGSRPLGLQEQLGQALADLAARTGQPAADIRVLQGRVVQWRSGALGCPEHGQMYTQALVPGVQLVLGVGGTVYHYHAAAGEQPFPCPDGRREAPAGGGSGLD